MLTSKPLKHFPWCLLFALAAPLLLIQVVSADSKKEISGYGDFIFGTKLADLGNDEELAEMFADEVFFEDGKKVLQYNGGCAPYQEQVLNGLKVQTYSRHEQFKIGDWKTPATDCICEVTFVDGILAGVRLVFDYLMIESTIPPEMRGDYATLAAATLNAKYDTSLLDAAVPVEGGFYCHWIDSGLNEINLSYLELSTIWLMTIRYTSPLYWEAFEGESDRQSAETESKL